MSGTGTPAPGTTTDTTGTPPPVTTATAPAAFDWGTAGLHADDLAHVTTKGYKSPADVVIAHRAAEKLIGVPADQVLKFPKEMTPEFEREAFTRLGRPAEAKDYEIATPKEGGFDQGFVDWARGAFDKANLTKGQAKALSEQYNDLFATRAAADKAALAKRDTEQVSTLTAEWGANMAKNTALVDRAATAFGMKPEHLAALKQVMGPADAMKFMFGIGSKLGADDGYVDGEHRTNQSFGMTPEQAQSEIALLRKDKDFIGKYARGDSEAKARMLRLNQAAYPGTTVV